MTIASSKRVLEQLDVGIVAQVMRAMKGTQKLQLRQQKQQDLIAAIGGHITTDDAYRA